MKKFIKITNGCENNLKRINVEFEKGRFTVVTGVSGSGKSSLVYDTIFKESQRLYFSSFPSWSRKYLGVTQKPLSDKISGLDAAIAIDQKNSISNPKSTVGTFSGIYDYLRLLFARFGYYNNQTGGFSRSLFSFNSETGACPKCKGFGVEDFLDPDLIVSDWSKSVRERALKITAPNGYIIYSQVTLESLDTVFKEYGFSVDTPLNLLSTEQIDVLFLGSDKIIVLFGKHTLESRMKWTGITVKPQESGYYQGFINVMNDILKRDRNSNILRFVRSVPCSECSGNRLNKFVLNVLYGSKNISEIANMTLVELMSFFQNINNENSAEESLKNQIKKMIQPLISSGLSYLSLSRCTDSLSANEVQRIRISAISESALRGATFIFDEPTVGLHRSESGAVIDLLMKIRDNGNTVIAVEHDTDTIIKADNIIETGPGGGINGGNIIFSGRVLDFIEDGEVLNSPTWKALNAKKTIPVQKTEITDQITLSNCKLNNLKSISPVFKKNAINTICGSSGSGKRSLMSELVSYFDKRSISYIKIDRSPIGRTPRSNPATYTGISDKIRDIFASSDDSKKAGLTKSHFSFNSAGGRCEKCEGAGVIEIGMKFMGSVRIVCDRCNGKRFNDEILKVKFRNMNISDVFDMSVEEALEFFNEYNSIVKPLKILKDLGTEYLKLGQTSSSLSGGEAQRIKLSTHLSKSKGNSFILFEEPATGLHPEDVQKLGLVLKAGIDKGNTVFAIENDLDFIINSDHVVELGPDSGFNGGRIVFSGSVSDLIKNDNTKTAKVLKNYLNRDIFKIKSENKNNNYLEKLQEDLVIEGIETHNLKNISLSVKPNKFNVITGVSGSGKTSLAFDTLFVECISGFLASVSPYVKTQILKNRSSDVSKSDGLRAPVGISSKFTSTGVRSTAGTVSGVYEIIRMMFSRAGVHKNGEPSKFRAADFSFNSETGACLNCSGTGFLILADIKKVITNPEKSFIDGAMDGTKHGKFYGDTKGQFVHTLIAVGNDLGIDFSKPVCKLTEFEKNIALFGISDREFAVSWHFARGNVKGIHDFKGKWIGFANLIANEFNRSIGNKNEASLRNMMIESMCTECMGKRLKKELLEVEVCGISFDKIIEMSAFELKDFISKAERTNLIQEAVINSLKAELLNIIERLINLGLGHISINRATASMSLGERERLKMTKSCLDGLTNIIYIIDEPSRGLHQSDSSNLVSVLKEIVNNGNTVVAIEHEPSIIKAADHIIELGPGSGNSGGKIIFQGSVEELIKKNTGTSEALKFKAEFKSTQLKEFIEIKHACPRNLKKFDLKIPVGVTTVITGVSGSGKTTLLKEVIGRTIKPENLFLSENKVSLSTSKLSTVATITGLSDLIKRKFGKGFKILKDDLCKNCNGTGILTITLDYLSDSVSECPDCNGTGYCDRIIEKKYNGKNIFELLSMEVSAAAEFFPDDVNMQKILTFLNNCGLEYLHLNQHTNSLSTGEVQRLNLVLSLQKVLSENSNNKKFFLFDEPSTGLHFLDIKKLIALFNSLNKSGHTVIIAEHRIQIISSADYIVELGPESGINGGYLIFQGIPDELIKIQNSKTAKVLFENMTDSF